MTGRNRLMEYMQMAQAGGPAPYDEEQFMPMPGSAAGANRFMASRLQQRTTPQMMEYMHGGYPGYAGRQQPDLGMMPRGEVQQPPNPMLESFRQRFGRDPATDMEMQMVYGPR